MIRKRIFGNNESEIFIVVIGQRYDTIKAKLESQTDLESISDDYNLVKLLKDVKVWMLY